MSTAVFLRRLALTIVIAVLAVRWSEQLWNVLSWGNLLLVLAGWLYVGCEALPAGKAALHAIWVEIGLQLSDEEFRNGD